MTPPIPIPQDAWFRSLPIDLQTDYLEDLSTRMDGGPSNLEHEAACRARINARLPLTQGELLPEAKGREFLL